MKKSVGIILMVGIMVLALSWVANCGEEIHWLYNTSPERDYIVEKLPEFEKATGIKVIADGVGWMGYREKLILSMTSGTGEYDVIDVPGQWFTEFCSSGFLTPLDTFLTNSELTPSDYDYEDFMPVMRDSFTWKDQKPYAISELINVPIMSYRTDLVQDVGVGLPCTWDEFTKVGDYFLSKGITPLVMPLIRQGALPEFFMAFLKTAGGSIFDENMEPVFNSPAGVAALQFLTTLVNKYVPQAAFQYHWQHAQDAFMKGEDIPFAFTMGSTAIQANDPSLSNVVGKVEAVPLPYKEKVGGVVMTWGFAIPHDVPHPEAAWKFITWVTGKDFTKQWALALRALNPRLSVLEDPEVAEKYFVAPATLETLNNPIFHPPIVQNAEFINILDLGISKALLGEATVEEALNSMVEEVRKLK